MINFWCRATFLRKCTLILGSFTYKMLCQPFIMLNRLFRTYRLMHYGLSTTHFPLSCSIKITTAIFPHYKAAFSYSASFGWYDFFPHRFGLLPSVHPLLVIFHLCLNHVPSCVSNDISTVFGSS